MTAEQRCYIAYLLRLWQEQRNAELVWRFSLEDAHTKERYGFSELELLFMFLRLKVKEENDENMSD